MPDPSHPLKPSLILHGGAWRTPEGPVEESRAGCLEALEAGWAILSRGGAAIDAVEAAITTMEDNPVFNAGTSANLNWDGHAELDAIVMDGGTLKAGAVAAVGRVRNPIRLARRVLEFSPHMLLAASGAEQFALEQGMELCDPADLITERSRAAWQRRRDSAKSTENTVLGKTGGTVGAVALDSNGNLLAGTSTGGTLGKHAGRVGDSPLIGCGCYADAQAGGVSCTGWGEAIMKIVMAKTAVELLRQAPANVGAASELAPLRPLANVFAFSPSAPKVSAGSFCSTASAALVLRTTLPACPAATSARTAHSSSKCNALFQAGHSIRFPIVRGGGLRRIL